MAQYTYLCSSCAHSFSIQQSIKDEPIRLCPMCGWSIERVIFASALDFRGSGWSTPGL